MALDTSKQSQEIARSSLPESRAPSNSHVTHLLYVQHTQSAHTVNHSGTKGPLAFALPTKKFHTFTHVHFPRKSSTKKRFPWPGREVSPEIDVSRHCQLCAIATSFFQACGETWSSKTGIPRGWDHFRPVPQRVTTALEFRRKRSDSLGQTGETPRALLPQAACNLLGNYSKRDGYR